MQLITESRELTCRWSVHKSSHLIAGQLGEVRWCTLVVKIELTWLTDSNEWVASIALVWAEAPCRT